jgi:hypothetical protein
LCKNSEYRQRVASGDVFDSNAVPQHHVFTSHTTISAVLT